MSGLIQYGAQLDSVRMRKTLEHIFKRNHRLETTTGRRGSPICIWGTHGLGKTTLVSDFAREAGWKLAYCAPAQFEEMGDFHGLPVLCEDGGARRTSFAPPTWVPAERGPGILLLDDINRADDRILRGLMQLLQRSALQSWALPAGWQIVATANPERSSYSVTPLDDAMLTRMINVTLVFSAGAWGRWAQQQGVDPRGIEFVLAYPEISTGQKTTPRTLVQLFGLLRSVPDLHAELDLVSALARSMLDEASAAAFVRHVAETLSVMIEADDILDAEDFGEIREKILAIARDERGLRLDRLSILCQRLKLRLTRAGERSPRAGENLVSFLLLEVLPNDLRMSLHQDLLRDGPPFVIEALESPHLTMKLLGGM